MARKVAYAGCMAFIAVFMFWAAISQQKRTDGLLYLVIAAIYTSVFVYSVVRIFQPDED